MTSLIWDEVTERTFQTGIDHGVLYLHDGRAVVWNGLTGLEETSGNEMQSYYLEGVKYLQNLLPGDFSGKLRAWTYPDEFDQVNGIVTVSPGLVYYEQPSQSFDLSYRTMIGNGLDPNAGYKIHLLYNVIATPEPIAYESLKKEVTSPTEFIWTITGTPPKIQSHRPTVHIAIDSLDTPQNILDQLEDILYGTVDQDPRLPPIDEIKALFGALGALIIVDNGDGTWSAVDISNDYVSMINSTTFQIDNANATYLDATTYEISNTYPEP